MLYGMYLSAAGMQTRQYELDVLANNMANVDTVGFKPEVVTFRDRDVEANEKVAYAGYRDPLFDAYPGGQFVYEATTDFRAGPQRHTGKPLDAAIEGDGFFAVQDGDTMRYSRDGRFTLQDDQLVRVADGRPVLGNNDQPIRIPQDLTAADIKIASDGSIYDPEGVLLDRLKIVRFEDTGSLQKAGHGLFSSESPGTWDRVSQVRQGYLEQSGTTAVRNLTSMIDVHRHFEVNARMISLQDQTLARLLSDIPKF